LALTLLFLRLLVNMKKPINITIVKETKSLTVSADKWSIN